MPDNKKYTLGEGTIGRINYTKCTVKKGKCFDALIDIYKNFFCEGDKKKGDNKNDDKKWIFRAEKRKKDKLDCEGCTDKSTCSKDDNAVFHTSLEKAFRSYEIDNADDRKKWEKDLIRNFKRKLHHYTNNVPADSDILEWLALMRHYFGPTCLLDCTYSFFVACYFAVNEIDCGTAPEQAEVWAIDANWLSYKEEKIERISAIIGSKRYKDFEKKAEKLAEEKYADKNCTLGNEIIYFLIKERKPCVYNVTPFRLKGNNGDSNRF